MMSDTNSHGIPEPEGKADVIDTDYEIGQDNIERQIGPFGLDIHNPVFLISGIAVVIFVFYTIALPEQAGAIFSAMFNFTTKNFDWFLIGSADLVVIFALLLIVTPFGNVRLGGNEAVADYTYLGWFAMLFAAGMGIGLMFYGVSEPLTHFSTSMGEITTENGLRTDWAPLAGASGDEAGSLRLGMAATIYHWGLHPWAIYAIVALALALFTYNKGLPLTIRSAFYPVLGERVWGWPGHIIDTIAVFATLFGLATSLGLGATQANAGLNELFGIPVGTTSEIVLISLITAVALVSVLRGLDGGVKVLSEVNMGLAALLALFTLIVGPTVFLLSFFWDSLVAYIEYLPALANPFGREDVNFSQGWTAFYWAWWISWSPFVGMFIARVSRGRTVREFIVCVLLIPSLVCVLWMSIFGGTAIHQVLNDGYTAAQDAGLPLQLFKMLDALPLASITSFIGIVLVVVFFVTSSDSGSLVIDTITAGGKVDAPVPQRVFWCIFEGAVAIALLIGGGLAALQSMVISTGLLFTLLLLFMCFCIFRGLQDERKIR
ncbi:BCCT family transporter [Sulfitobacter sp. M85]|nr:BCCT family transporter [Sulfitobacter sp. Ks11]MDF3387638.1 BCCT family transporter [Sulfitobacter sp. M85]MDF3391058.1 BCCT family transporter [Sulfitobacter sp. Ks16]MDF3401696.1 BCCT family transporter [Sulfitobacter sp. KE39]MDF3405117.1 BCCT family transporter [Sulfitobacter sp. Ks35]MDF3412195.1 BCCT family transporter [Sulfitobacter sp. KE38]